MGQHCQGVSGSGGEPRSHHPADFNRLGNQTIEKETLYAIQLTEPYSWQNCDLFYDQHPYFRIGYQNPLNNTSSGAARCLGPYRSSRNFFHESADHFYPKKMDVVEDLITTRLQKKFKNKREMMRSVSEPTLDAPKAARAPSEAGSARTATTWTWTVASDRHSQASGSSRASRPRRSKGR
jgi:hypothetical protein